MRSKKLVVTLYHTKSYRGELNSFCNKCLHFSEVNTPNYDPNDNTRRDGDIGAAFAKADRAKSELNWEAQMGIEAITFSSALRPNPNHAPNFNSNPGGHRGGRVAVAADEPRWLRRPRQGNGLSVVAW